MAGILASDHQKQLLKRYSPKYPQMPSIWPSLISQLKLLFEKTLEEISRCGPNPYFFPWEHAAICSDQIKFPHGIPVPEEYQTELFCADMSLFITHQRNPETAWTTRKHAPQRWQKSVHTDSIYIYIYAESNSHHPTYNRFYVSTSSPFPACTSGRKEMVDKMGCTWKHRGGLKPESHKIRIGSNT